MRVFGVVLVGVGVVVGGVVVGGAAPEGVVQGWTRTEREIWWNSPLGSRIVPYEWFLRLEQAGGGARFAAPGRLAGYGYLAGSVNPTNPDGLPIGFARERARDGSTWLGMTCAACHTGVVSYVGRTLAVEGGGALVDTQRFDRDLSAALAATAEDDGRFGRLADGLGTLEADRGALRERVRAVAAGRAAFTAMNAAPHDAGPGRMDAMGVMMNALAAAALNMPGNARAADAPVRLPWVWNSARASRVPYNGSMSNAGLGPLLWNIGQALGAYGTVEVGAPGLGYASSVSVPDLEKLEALVRKLEPPKWPEMFPPIDAAKAGRGAAVFAQACGGCHAGQGVDGAGLVAVPVVPLEQVGTDPKAAQNVTARMAETGVLEGRPIGVFGGPVFGPRAGAAAIVAHVSTGVAVQVPRERLQAGLNAYRAAMMGSAGRLDGYKAGPLAGVWAGAPYLHNGSVASLAELLKPAGERAVRFSVGGRDYDPGVVGYPGDAAGAGYVLDTGLAGNSNAGHAYGTGLTAGEKEALLEYLKGL